MKIVVCAPSYKRPNGVETFKYLPFCRVYVAQREYEDYRKNYPGRDIVAAPDDRQGNLCRIRNYILDTEFANGADVVLLVDDDLQGVYFWEGKQKHKIPHDSFLGFVEKYSLVCQEWGFKFWGVNINADKQVYREYSPFSTVSYIGGPFQCFLRGNDLRYDERVNLKEDYDMTIQNMNRYRGALRVNKAFYVAKQSEQPGGCASQRNFEKEKEQFNLLQKKWGAEIVSRDRNDRSHGLKRKKVREDYNPVIKIPIRGI